MILMADKDITAVKLKKLQTKLGNKGWIITLIKSFVNLKSNFSCFPRWSHNFSLREFPQT